MSAMRLRLGLAAALCAVLGLLATSAAAQVANGQRDCQTLVTCQYARGASFRGCVSSYSCRVCRLVSRSCTAGASRSVCQRMQCSWG